MEESKISLTDALEILNGLRSQGDNMPGVYKMRDDGFTWDRQGGPFLCSVTLDAVEAALKAGIALDPHRVTISPKDPNILYFHHSEMGWMSQDIAKRVVSHLVSPKVQPVSPE